MASSRSTLGSSTALSGYHAASTAAPNVHDNGSLSVSDQLMQLDLAITSTLQEIDANFARAHQIVTAQLLPAVKVYGQHSSKTWETAKFWQDFFITAAQVPLKRSEEGETSQGYDANDQSGYGDNSGSSQREDSPGYDQTNSQDDSPLVRGLGGANKGRRTNDSQADESLTEDDLYRNSRNARSSPAAHNDPEASWASVDSVFDRLKKEMAAEPVDSNLSRAENRLAQHRAQKESREKALLGKSGTDDAHDPVNGLAEGAKGLTLSKGKPTFRSPARLHHGTPKLLNKVLNAEHKKADGKQRTPIAGESKRNPFQANGTSTSKWNGIADLRETPLAMNKSRPKGNASSKKTAAAINTPQAKSRKAWYDDSDDDIALPPGMSPPVTMQFSVARSRYDKTPAKEAARYIVEDVLRTCEGPTTIARNKHKLMQQQQSKFGSAGSPAGQLRAGRIGAVTASNSAVASPLKTGPAGPQKRRDSMPTPPTLTKTLKSNKTPVGGAASVLPGSAASSAAASGHRAARLFDADEEGGVDGGDDLMQLQAGPSASFASAQSRADVDDDEDDSDEEDSFSSSSDEDDPGQGGTGSVHSSVSKNLSTFSSVSGTNTNTNSFSRSGWSSSGGNASGLHAAAASGGSIDNDTLFGVGKLSTRAAPSGMGGAGGAGTTATTNTGAMGGAAGGFRMIGQVEDTVQGGKLLDDDKDLTYSAPSPTPWK